MQSLAPTLIKLPYLLLFSNPEYHDFIVQVFLIRAGAKLCMKVDLRAREPRYKESTCRKRVSEKVFIRHCVLVFWLWWSITWAWTRVKAHQHILKGHKYWQQWHHFTNLLEIACFCKHDPLYSCLQFSRWKSFNPSTFIILYLFFDIKIILLGIICVCFCFVSVLTHVLVQFPVFYYVSVSHWLIKLYTRGLFCWLVCLFVYLSSELFFQFIVHPHHSISDVKIVTSDAKSDSFPWNGSFGHLISIKLVQKTN